MNLVYIVSAAHRKAKCSLFLGGELWHPQHTEAKTIHNGDYIRATVLTNVYGTDSCSSTSTSSSSSRPRPRASNPERSLSRSRSRPPSFVNDEDTNTLMQTTAVTRQEEAHQQVNDQVYRLLSTRRERFAIPPDRGFPISVWKTDRDSLLSHHEHRVWLDPQHPTWTETCLQAVGRYEGEEKAGEPFALATPGPIMTRLTNNNFNLLYVDKLSSKSTTILVDWQLFGLHRRAIVTYFQGASTKTIAHRLLQVQPTDEVHLEWQTREGNVHFRDQQEIFLPNGASTTLWLADASNDCLHQDEDHQDDLALLQWQVTKEKLKILFRSKTFWPYGYQLQDYPNHHGRDGHAPGQDHSDNFDIPPPCQRMFQHKTEILNFTDFDRLSHQPSPTRGLKPPGNPKVIWSAKNLHALDELYHAEGYDEIRDYDHQQGRIRPIPTPLRQQARPQVKLQLDQLIPQDREIRRNIEVTPRRIDLQIDDDFYLDILKYNDDDNLQQDTTKIPDLHPNSQRWLLQGCVPTPDLWDPMEAQEIHIYTDGSYCRKEGLSAWSFIAVAHIGDQERLIGFTGALVHTDHQHQHHIGTLSQGATQAELEAMFWSSMWSCKFVSSSCWEGVLHFHWDSTTAGSKSMGSAATNIQAQGRTAHYIRCLQQALCAMLRPERVKHGHIRAHEGHPCNELADAAAKAALQQQWKNPYSGPSVAVIEAACPIAFEMMWYRFACEDTRRSLPQFQDGQLQWTTTRGNPFKPDPQQTKLIIESMLGPQTALKEGKKQIHFELHMATYNAMTLGSEVPKQQTLHADQGRAALVRQQVQQQKLHILAIQEARTKSGCYHSQTHYRFASGAEDGHGGIEIWFGRQLPYASTQDAKYSFKEKFFHVTFTSSSILVVQYKDELINLTVVGAHAPHNGHDNTIKEEWWQNLRQVCRTNSTDQLILLIDANARINQQIDQHFGGLSQEHQDGNGERLRAAAEELHLWAPSTFPHIHRGQQHTWVHPAGNYVSRIDYVLLPLSWSQMQIWSYVNHHISSGLSLPDHACAAVYVKWTAEERPVVRKNKKFNKIQACAPENAHVLADIVRQTPTLDWQMNASEHAAILTDWIQAQLCEKFPPQPRRKAPSFASNSSIESYATLQHGKRAIRHAQALYNYKLQYLCFRFWSQSSHYNEIYWPFRELRDLRFYIAKNYKMIQTAAKHLKQHLRTDRRAYVDTVVKDAAHLSVTEIYKALRPIMKTSKQAKNPHRPLPTVMKEDGTPTKDLAEYNLRWAQYFADLEAGTISKPEEYLQDVFQEQADQLQPQQIHLTELPQLAWIEAAAQRIHRGKATGFDQIPGEIFKADPAATARAMLPILLKYTLRLEEPACAKGGRLVKLYKQKGPMNICASFRSIMLVGSMAKLLRAATRTTINLPYQTNSDSMQLAGKKGMPVSFGAQAVRHFLAIHKQMGKSCMALFGDVKSAYYQTVRQLAVGATRSDETVARIASHFNIDPSVMPQIQEALEGNTGQRFLHGSEFQNDLLRQSLSTTWSAFTTEQVIHTEKGSRPGDPWADVVFNVIFCRVVQAIRQELQQEGLQFTLPVPALRQPHIFSATPQDISPAHVTWADDIAVLAVLNTQVERSVANATTLLLGALHRHGMQATIGEGKTAALLAVRGSQAVHAKRRLFSSPKASIPVIMETELVHLPLISQYRHLGGLVVVSGSLLPELHVRSGRARTSYWRLAKDVFRSRHLELKKKIAIFRSTVLALWTWGSGSWNWLTTKEYDYFQATTWQLYRLLCPKQNVNRQAAPGQILTTLGLPHPQDLLHEARLRNIGQMMRFGPSELWALQVNDTSARHASGQALEWMRQALQHDSGLPHYSNWEPWQTLMTDKPQQWKRLIAMAAGRQLRFRQSQYCVTNWHKRILAELTLPTTESMPTADPPPPQRHERCVLCHQVFKNRRAWFLHAHLKHGYVTPAGRAAQGKGQDCAVCAKRYPTNLALQHHLRYSQRCCTYYLLQNHLTSSPEGVDQHPQCPWRHTRLDPVGTAETEDFEARALEATLHDRWQHCEQELHEDTAERWATEILVVLHCVLPFPRIFGIFVLWVRKFEDEVSLTFLPQLHAVQQIVVRWFCEQCTDDSTVDPLQPSLETELQRGVLRPLPVHPHTWSYLPMEVYYLHFFSGRRRPGDLQAALSRCRWPGGVSFYVLSLDVQVCSTTCDLTQESHQALWINLIRTRRVAGSTAGPPCETWSMARSNNVSEQPAHDPHLPRPLRDRRSPWGFLHVSKRENQQLQIGNQLMLLALLCALLEAVYGGFTVLEHPRDPSTFGKAAHHPAVWGTAIMDWLMATNLFSQLFVNQGAYGAKSAKPTQLLVSGLSAADMLRIEKASRTTAVPTTSSIGRDDQGWRTSSLKEYPPAFCDMLATMFQEWIWKCWHLKTLEVTDDTTWLRKLCIDLETRPQAESYGPDFFQGHKQPEFNN